VVDRLAQTMHTDSSKQQLDIRKSIRLPDHCSVFQAEVHAIKEALTCLGTLASREDT